MNIFQSIPIGLFRCIVVLLTIFNSPSSSALAESTQAAVASNFHNPFSEIVRSFEEQSNHRVQIVAGSTGKLYAQIMHGAPFDLFLSADQQRPRLLVEQGQAVADSQSTYASGRISLWSLKNDIQASEGESVLKNGNFSHLAIANPKTAPYGLAAMQTLKQMGLWDSIRPRLVQGENIGQTFQFIASQNAKLGFVALSQILDPSNAFDRDNRWDVPETYHDPLRQDVVILNRGAGNPATKALWKFLKSDAAQEIIKKYGYGLE